MRTAILIMWLGACALAGCAVQPRGLVSSADPSVAEADTVTVVSPSLEVAILTLPASATPPPSGTPLPSETPNLTPSPTIEQYFLLNGDKQLVVSVTNASEADSVAIARSIDLQP